MSNRTSNNEIIIHTVGCGKYKDIIIVEEYIIIENNKKITKTIKL